VAESGNHPRAAHTETIKIPASPKIPMDFLIAIIVTSFLIFSKMKTRKAPKR
jgi:hypothetical protein